MKNIFLGKDEFKVKKQIDQGRTETVMKIKQSDWDMGQDRMELKDKTADKVVAIVRRSRNPMTGDCFYIYTVEEPYPGAKKNSWNEKLGDELLYCFGFLQNNWGWGYSMSVHYADAEKGPDPDGKDPYKKVYKLVPPGWFSPDTAIHQLDDEGNVKNEAECVAFSSRDFWQWDVANAYAVEVAPGVDSALMVISMAMLDEIQEDNKDKD